MKKCLQVEEVFSVEYVFWMVMEDLLMVGMWVCDLNGKVIYVNLVFCKIIGFISEEIVGRIFFMFYWILEQIDEIFVLY